MFKRELKNRVHTEDSFSRIKTDVSLSPNSKSVFKKQYFMGNQPIITRPRSKGENIKLVENLRDPGYKKPPVKDKVSYYFNEVRNEATSMSLNQKSFDYTPQPDSKQA